ncbi:phosphatidate cytidylyltransferase [Rhizobium sp. CRIBSB]|nr:phosphatidate cytidylyltransferase [Rhizobium sp. CRIBSB]
MGIRVREIGVRIASAMVLAPAAVLAIWAGGLWYLALIVAACLLLAREWAAMSAPGKAWPIAATVALALVAVTGVTHVGALSAALVVLVFAAVAAALFARRLGEEPVDAAYGVLYLGWPAILLIWLRGDHDLIGLNWTMLVFVVAWSSDVLAYLAGSLIGGPKLWPRFSPNKTWAGFTAGLIGGAGAGLVLTSLLSFGLPHPAWGALLGLVGALATMAGDLWESALKRRFGVKDAGDLIPGHGGLLDRVDGMMFAVVVIAAARLIVLMMDRAA